MYIQINNYNYIYIYIILEEGYTNIIISDVRILIIYNLI